MPCATCREWSKYARDNFIIVQSQLNNALNFNFRDFLSVLWLITRFAYLRASRTYHQIKMVCNGVPGSPRKAAGNLRVTQALLMLLW